LSTHKRTCRLAPLAAAKTPAINKTQVQVVEGTKAVILSVAPTGQGFTTQIPDVETQQVFGWTEDGYQARGQAPYDTENHWIAGWLDAHTAVVPTDKGVLLFDARTGTSKVVEAVQEERTEEPGHDEGEDHGEAPIPEGEDPGAGPPK
jgi:hypothetical protein